MAFPSWTVSRGDCLKYNCTRLAVNLSSTGEGKGLLRPPHPGVRWTASCCWEQRKILPLQRLHSLPPHLKIILFKLIISSSQTWVESFSPLCPLSPLSLPSHLRWHVFLTSPQKNFTQHKVKPTQQQKQNKDKAGKENRWECVEKGDSLVGITPASSKGGEPWPIWVSPLETNS